MKLSTAFVCAIAFAQNGAAVASEADMASSPPSVVSVCSAANPSLLGRYTRDADPARTLYSNEQGMSFFRNREFWYLGDVAKWPPETHYRCVDAEEVCNVGGDAPAASALGGWTVNKRVVKTDAPIEIVIGECPDDNEEGEL